MLDRRQNSRDKVIYGGVAKVDDLWFDHAPRTNVLGLIVRLTPAEEMIWSKAFIQERERYDGADVAHEALGDISKMVAELAEAAESIMASVKEQRTTAAAIEATARETAIGATRITEQVISVAAVANDTEALSGRVSEAATGLSGTARRLKLATEQFVAQLSAA